MQLCPLGEPLKRDNFLLEFDCGNRRDTRTNSDAIDVNRAGTALAKSAAEARAVQSQIVTKCIEQRHLRIVIFHRRWLAIDVEWFRFCHLCLPTTSVDAGVCRDGLMLAFIGTRRDYEGSLGCAKSLEQNTKPAP